MLLAMRAADIQETLVSLCGLPPRRPGLPSGSQEPPRITSDTELLMRPMLREPISDFGNANGKGKKGKFGKGHAGAGMTEPPIDACCHTSEQRTWDDSYGTDDWTDDWCTESDVRS